MFRGDRSDLLDANAQRDDFICCGVSAALRFENAGSPEEFSAHRRHEAERSVVRREAIGARFRALPKSRQAAFAEILGAYLPTDEDNTAAEEAVAAYDAKVSDPVGTYITNLRRELEAAVGPVTEDALDQGMDISGRADDAVVVRADAPLFGSLDDFGAFLKGRYSRWERFKQTVGLSARPSAPPPPSIAAEVNLTLHGPRPAIEALVGCLREGLLSVGGVRKFEIGWRPSPYKPKLNASGEPVQWVPPEKRERTPLPSSGAALIGVLVEIGDAFKAEDAPAAFVAADRLVAMLREDKDVLRLVRQAPSFHPWQVNEVFKAPSDRQLIRSVADRVTRWKADSDHEALCDFVFEMRSDAEGLFRELLGRIELVRGGIHGHEFYDDAFAKVFGDPANAHLHFIAFMRDDHEPRTQRLRAIDVKREASFARIDALRAEEEKDEAGLLSPGQEAAPGV